MEHTNIFLFAYARGMAVVVPRSFNRNKWDMTEGGRCVALTFQELELAGNHKIFLLSCID